MAAAPLSKKDIENLLEAAISPLRTQNSTLQNEISTLKSQIGVGADPREAARIQRASILKEEREAAERRIRERLEQGNIAIGDDEDLGFSSSNLHEKIKVSDLDEFDGTDIYSFFMSIDAALSQFSPKLVAGVMARNLKGIAKVWFQNLNELSREAVLSNAFTFKEALRQEFEEDKAISRQTASDRKWQVTREPLMTYFYEKLKLITNAFKGMDSTDQCLEIREGLPDDFKLLVRTTMAAKPTLDHLRKELKTLEQDYLANRKKKPFAFQQQQVPQQALVKSPAQNLVKTEQGNGKSGNRRPPSLRDTFNPKFIGQSPNPANPSQMIRTYTVPDGSNRVLMLNRPCRTCGGNHFDFEQVHSQFVEIEENDNYTIQSAVQAQSFSGYPTFTPQSLDPLVQMDSSAYPTWGISNEEYAYQIMRSDSDGHGCFIPDDQRIQDVSSPISISSSSDSPKN